MNLEGRAVPIKPGAGDVAISHNPRAPMNGPTQYQETYKQYVQFERPLSFKVNHKYEPPKEPVCTDTVYNADYTSKAIIYLLPLRGFKT